MRALAALVLVAGGAFAQDYTHRGALGLTVSSGGEYVTSAATQVALNGFLAPIEVGGTWALNEHNELRLAGRFSVPGPILYGSVYAGLRNSRGERFKTFFDLDLAVHVSPFVTAGVRLGLGAQFEILPVMGVYAALGLQGGGGAGLRLSFELTAGLQFRTYILGG